jgi:hypothetical protein
MRHGGFSGAKVNGYGEAVQRLHATGYDFLHMDMSIEYGGQKSRASIRTA